MLDDFREWLSDNLRYILLGLGIIIAVIIVFCIVRLITGSGRSSSSAQSSTVTVQTETTASAAESATESDAASVTSTITATESSELVKDDAAIKTLVQQYYTAVAASDTTTLSQIVEPWNDEVQSQVLGSNVIEAYENIATYSKTGLQDGEYVVFAYYEAKLPDIETTVPSLSMLYVSTDASGSLIINSNRETDSEIAAFTTQAASEADAAALISQVNQAYEQALAQDEALSSYIASISSSSASADTDTMDDGSDSSASQTATGTASAGATLTATTTLNIRQTASTSAAIMGILPEGTSVTALSDEEDGWIQIEYVTSSGNIDGYVMLEYLTVSSDTSSAASSDTTADDASQADDAA